MTVNSVNTHASLPKLAVPGSGLPVRTNLRAGLAWDDLDDQAKALWSKLTSAVKDAANQVTNSMTTTSTS